MYVPAPKQQEGNCILVTKWESGFLPESCICGERNRPLDVDVDVLQMREVQWFANEVCCFGEENNVAAVVTLIYC